MSARRPLVLDLDGTLLHSGEVVEAVKVPGRTSCSYLAPETIDWLRLLSAQYRLVIATGRSLDATRLVLEGLAARGVVVGDLILEDGALLGSVGALHPLEPRRRWGDIRAAIEGTSLPLLEWQEDFTACLVARASDAKEAAQLERVMIPDEMKRAALLRTFRDGRKVYVTGEETDKWRALQQLLGNDALRATGIGDGLNDLCWLARIERPCTLGTAKKAVWDLVSDRGGVAVPTEGHSGIVEVLKRLHRSYSRPEYGDDCEKPEEDRAIPAKLIK